MKTDPIRHWLSEVSKAAAAFERRWTWLALKRVDAELAQRFEEQRSLFDTAIVTGDVSDVEVHGPALCRGYQALVRTMEAAQAPDDAYLLGLDHKTGFRIAVGQQRAAAERVAEIHGSKVVWVTPDEIAAILAGLEAFKGLASIKRMFPGAEVIDVYPGEPAKFDGEAA